MLKFGFIAAVISLSIAQNAVACEKPDPISIPNGSKASEKEMQRADSALKKYMKGMQSYQSCIQAESELERRRGQRDSKLKTKTREDKYAQLHNEASSEMIQTTDSFSQAVKVFKALE